MNKYYILSLFIIGCLAQSMFAQPIPKTEIHRNPTQTGTEALRNKETGWYAAVSTKGSFSAAFPYPFSDMTMTGTDQGIEFNTYMLAAQTIEGLRFTVMEIAPKFPNAKKLQDIEAGYRNQKDYCSDINHTPLGEYASIALYTKRQTDAAFIRMIDMGDRMLMATMEYPNIYAKIAEPLGNQFLSSLRLKNQNSGTDPQPIVIVIPKGSETPDAVPAADRIWLASDYKQMAALVIEGKVSLPALADKNGAALFQRITSRENIKFYTDKKIPINQRMPSMLELTEGLNAINKMYYMTTTRADGLITETARMQAFQLYNAEGTTALADEFLATIPRDEKFMVRMSGMAQMRTGLSQILVGALATALDPRCTIEGRDALLIAMSDTLPALKRCFDMNLKTTFRSMLEAGIKNQKESNVVYSLTGLLKELDKADPVGVSAP